MFVVLVFGLLVVVEVSLGNILVLWLVLVKKLGRFLKEFSIVVFLNRELFLGGVNVVVEIFWMVGLCFVEFVFEGS